jgi:purine catabolism regulator
MSVTVRDVLSLDIVQAGDPHVVAGESNLDRAIRWVHIADVVEVAPLLKGSELLLTSGLGLSLDPSRQRGYVRDLAQAGVAGVFMTMGWAYREPPDSLVVEARRAELPFVVLNRPIPFVEVTERVHADILNRQFALIRKADRIGRDFTDLVLQGSGPRSVVEALGQVVNKPVVLETINHQVVEFWEPAVLGTNAVARWESHARQGHVDAGPPLRVVAEDEGAGRCAWAAIPLRREAWGRLHVLMPGGPLDDMDRLALGHAAIAIAMLLLSQRYADAVLDQAGSDLISELVRGTAFVEEDVLARARALGCDLRIGRLAAMAVDGDDFAEFVRERRLEQEEIQGVKRAMLQATRRAVAETGCQEVSSVISDEVLSIVAVPAGRDVVAALDQVGGRIRELIPAMQGGLTATVGFSRPVSSVLGLSHAFTEAREAVAYGKGPASESGVHHYERLGLDTLILRLRESAELPQFVEDELGPLLDHDARRSPKLLPTLQAYLEHGGNKSATAKAIHLERRSLYHRLERISDLLNRNLNDAEIRTRLFVALRALPILRRANLRGDDRTR